MYPPLPVSGYRRLPAGASVCAPAEQTALARARLALAGAALAGAALAGAAAMPGMISPALAAPTMIISPRPGISSPQQGSRGRLILNRAAGSAPATRTNGDLSTTW